MAPLRLRREGLVWYEEPQETLCWFCGVRQRQDNTPGLTLRSAFWQSIIYNVFFLFSKCTFWNLLSVYLIIMKSHRTIVKRYRRGKPVLSYRVLCQERTGRRCLSRCHPVTWTLPNLSTPNILVPRPLLGSIHVSPNFSFSKSEPNQNYINRPY